MKRENTAKSAVGKQPAAAAAAANKPGLFDEPRETCELFDSLRMHVVLRANLSEREVREGNEYWKRSLCPNLSWRSMREGVTRKFVIKR